MTVSLTAVTESRVLNVVFTCSKLAKRAIEQLVKYIQS